MLRSILVASLLIVASGAGGRSRRAIVEGEECVVGYVMMYRPDLLIAPPSLTRPGQNPPSLPGPGQGGRMPGQNRPRLPPCRTFVDQSGTCWVGDMGIDTQACIRRYGQEEYDSLPRGQMK